MIKVMAFGSFDLLHKGHVEYFRQAKSFGDYLIVVISRDSNYIKTKNEKPMFLEEERRKIVSQNEFVDEAILGNENDLYKVVIDNKPDVLCLGYDQKVNEEKLKESLLKRGLKNIKIVRAVAHKPEIYKSSLFKKKISK